MLDARTHLCRRTADFACSAQPDAAPSFWRLSGALPVALASLLDCFDRVSGGLELDQNPWEHPPESLVAGGLPAVRNYFEAIYEGGTTAVTRPLKVVIVGRQTVGKTRCEGSTSLVQQFCS